VNRSEAVAVTIHTNKKGAVAQLTEKC